MIKYGIKLWATNNKDWFEEAVDLCNKKQVDFVELYVVADSFELKELEILKKAPTIIHSPHFKHNFNIFDLGEEQITVFKNQVISAADFLKSKYIVLHAGVGDNLKIFKENFKKISDSRIIIENMPKIGLNDKICFGYSLEQLEFIKDKCGLKICLDIAHAIKSAISQKIDHKEYLESLIKELAPNYFHISDGKLDNEKDEHLNLGEGGFDLKWVKNNLMRLANKNDVDLVFETPKEGENLENDMKNIDYFKVI